MIVTDAYGDLVERLGNEAEEGFFHTAAQVVVRHRGETLVDAAVGRTHLHDPFERTTLSALYCTAKPIVAVAVLRLVAEDELSLEDRLGDVVDDLPTTWIADRTIEQVLAHTAGLHVVNTILARILPERSRQGWVDASPPPDGWRFGVDRAYSEFGGWFLLGRVIEALTDRPFDQYVRDAVLDPYGVEAEDLVLRISAEDHPRLAPSGLCDARPHDRPSCAAVGRGRDPRLPRSGTRRSAPTEPWRRSPPSTRASWRDLDGAGKVLPAELLALATAARLPLSHDVTLDRDAGFGLGFMTPLSSHYFGDRPSSLRSATPVRVGPASPGPTRARAGGSSAVQRRARRGHRVVVPSGQPRGRGLPRPRLSSGRRSP